MMANPESIPFTPKGCPSWLRVNGTLELRIAVKSLRVSWRSGLAKREPTRPIRDDDLAELARIRR